MILLVDGSNLLFQMFYGMPNVINGKKGYPIQGTLGFIGALLKMIKMTGADRVAVFFDGECTNPRNELSTDYKANRPDYDDVPYYETPFSQLPDIYSALKVMGIAHATTECCEADDWLAGYARIPNERIIISSGDSDLFQLISDNVQILRYRGDKTAICDREYVYSKLGVYPERYADFKCLTGDNSDNIRGCDKVGPKTAAQLVAQFSTLEEMIERSYEIKKPSVRLAVDACAERIMLNRRLIKLDYDGPLPISESEMVYTGKYTKTRDVLDAIGI